jgi:hypothetical protein
MNFLVPYEIRKYCRYTTHGAFGTPRTSGDYGTLGNN